MRRLVAALAALALTFALAGCGGGEPPAAATTPPPADTSQPAATPPPSSTGIDVSLVEPDKSPTETVDFQPLELSKSIRPKSIEQRLEAGQPMLVLFYDPSQKVTDDVRAEVDAVVKKYRGMIDLVAFDVSRALSNKKSDADSKKIALVASTLGVRVTPYIIVVDKSGLQTAKYAGFVDRSILEREVLRATD